MAIPAFYEYGVPQSYSCQLPWQNSRDFLHRIIENSMWTPKSTYDLRRLTFSQAYLNIFYSYKVHV